MKDTTVASIGALIFATVLSFHFAENLSWLIAFWDKPWPRNNKQVFTAFVVFEAFVIVASMYGGVRGLKTRGKS